MMRAVGTVVERPVYFGPHRFRKYWRENPEQYFWTHKRFKTRSAGEPKWY